jgi:hypothetical protein
MAGKAADDPFKPDIVERWDSFIIDKLAKRKLREIRPHGSAPPLVPDIRRTTPPANHWFARAIFAVADGWHVIGTFGQFKTQSA